MKFYFDGYYYEIEFRREHRILNVGKGPDGTDIEVKSKYPYTTVWLWRSDDPKTRELVATHTVGAWHKEPKFTNEIGRLHALRAMSTTLDKDLKQQMWHAYLNRGNEVVEGL